MKTVNLLLFIGIILSSCSCKKDLPKAPPVPQISLPTVDIIKPLSKQMIPFNSWDSLVVQAKDAIGIVSIEVYQDGVYFMGSFAGPLQTYDFKNLYYHDSAPGHMIKVKATNTQGHMAWDSVIVMGY